jgi:hypothetical protein
MPRKPPVFPPVGIALSFQKKMGYPPLARYRLVASAAIKLQSFARSLDVLV